MSLKDLMAPVATDLLGKPTSKNGGDWRYGKKGSLSVDVNKGVFYDYESGEGGGVIALVQRHHNGDALEYLEELTGEKLKSNGDDGKFYFKSFKSARAARNIYDAAVEELPPVAVKYLSSRGIDSGVSFPGLRWSESEHALVVPVGPASVQRIVLSEDGTKLKKLSRGPMDGGWHLAREEPKATFILEGPEDGMLAFQIFGKSDVIVSIGEARLEAMAPLVRTKTVVIVPDADTKQKHIDDLSARLQDAGREVYTLAMPDGCKDLNDVLLTHGEGAVVELAKARTLVPLSDQKPVDGEVHASPTELSLANDFARQMEDHARHVAKWGRWLYWEGGVWKEEETTRAFDEARYLVWAEADRAPTAKLRNQLSRAATVAAVERLAKAGRRIAATTDIWDRDTGLLNSPGGVVDLATGDIRPHRPEDYMTKSTAVSPAPPGTEAPMWLRFLDRIFEADQEVIASLQRYVGYCLTGSTQEHKIAFLHGVGRNGKSVFLNTTSRIMNDYAVAAPMEVFVATNQERHSTDVAGLRGARLVTAQEVESGRRWDEAKVKALTGGDPITARFMRQDNFTFDPQFSLILAGNHKPRIRNVDVAIRSRFLLFPFRVIIPEDERDPLLAQELEAEWPAILRWMIDGCLQWQEIGLAPCQAILDATEEYMNAEDQIASWIEDHCIEDPNAMTRSMMLYENYKEWCERNGLRHGTQKAFSEKLSERQLDKTRDSKGRWAFIGLEVKNGDED